MSTTETLVESPSTRRLSIVERAGTGLALALVLNGIVRLAAGALLDVGGIQPLSWIPIVAVTVIATLGATVVYVAISRFSTRPDRHFTMVAGLVLLLSMGPIVTLVGVSTAILAVLAILHVTTAVSLVAGLTGTVHR